MYGSVINGLMIMDPKSPSDLDLTVISEQSLDFKEENTVKRVKNILLKNKLDNTKWKWSLNEKTIILKATFGDLLEFDLEFLGDEKRKKMKIQVQITQEKILEVCNSNLLQSYCKLDSRFRKLAIVLKAWNKTLADDKNDRFNSFTICLLLLGFMLHREYFPNL